MTDYPVYMETEEEDTLGGCVFPAFAFLILLLLILAAALYLMGNHAQVY